MKKLLFFLLLLLLFGCSTGTIVQQDKNVRQEQKNLSTTFKKDVSINYLQYLPKDYDKKDKWPLLLFLHGAGERGNNLELVKKHGPPKLIEQGKDFPFIVVSPQCPDGIRWKTEPLIALIDFIIENYNVDENRIYITGLSMGGYGTWKLANEISHRLAAVVPICGWGDPLSICEVGDLPIWVFHGAKDNVVPVQSSQAMVDRLKSCGHEVKFTIYPETMHDSWTETYDNMELYEWLLKQSKDQRKVLGARWF